MWFSKYVGGINLYPKESYYYLDLPCVASIYLLTVNKFRVFCLKLFKILSLFLHMALELTPIVQSFSQEK